MLKRVSRADQRVPTMGLLVAEQAETSARFRVPPTQRGLHDDFWRNGATVQVVGKRRVYELWRMAAGGMRPRRYEGQQALLLCGLSETEQVEGACGWMVTVCDATRPCVAIQWFVPLRLCVFAVSYHALLDVSFACTVAHDVRSLLCHGACPMARNRTFQPAVCMHGIMETS
jgi:hypothetical protein